MGLGRKAPNWSNEELNFLYDNHENMTPEELASNLPKRTKNAVKTKLRTLGMTKKLEEDITEKKGKRREKTELELSLERHDEKVRNEFWHGVVTTRKELGLCEE